MKKPDFFFRKLAKENKSLKEMYKFASYLLRQFFDSFEKNPKLFMEACFWKTTKEAEEVGSGQYENTGGATARQKASFWSEDDEEKLTRFFAQYKEMKEKGEESVDIVDSLTDMFEESGKTRKQIIRKLKQLELIQVKPKEVFAIKMNCALNCRVSFIYRISKKFRPKNPKAVFGAVSYTHLTLPTTPYV